MQDPQQPPELTPFQHGVIGALVGSIEQAIMRPSCYWKAQLQQQRLTLATALNPRYAYRGLPVAVASIAPVTAVQFAAANFCLDAIRRTKGGAALGSEPTEMERFASSAFAGLASASVQSPFQLVEVNQQNNGGTMASCTRKVLATHGVSGLYRGGSMTFVREGIFCSSYMAMAPYVKRRILARFPDLPDNAAMAAAAIISGSTGAVLSHPADTIKTRLQGSLFDDVKASGPTDMAAKMQESGPLTKQLFRGFAPRVFRIIACTYIYSGLTDIFEDLARTVVARASFELHGATAAPTAAQQLAAETSE